MSSPRTLIIDIETTPNITYSWGLFKQNIGINQIVEPSRMMCFAAKWLGEEETMFFAEWINRDLMLDAAYRLLDEAHILMHYNGNKFDVPILRKELILAGYKPPSPFKNIDLWQVVSRQFKFTSSKLEYVSRQLGLEGTVAHSGFELWKAVMARVVQALDLMETYNRQDVELLVDLYEVLLPWIPNHPNQNLYTQDETPVCTNCASGDLIREGYAYTALGKYQRYSCRDCGKWSRGNKRIDGAAVQSAL